MKSGVTQTAEKNAKGNNNHKERVAEEESGKRELSFAAKRPQQSALNKFRTVFLPVYEYFPPLFFLGEMRPSKVDSLKTLMCCRAESVYDYYYEY